MKTTELHIEYFLSGILALVWIYLIYITAVGIDPALLNSLLAHSVLLGSLILAISYPLGIFMDSLSDALLDWKDKEIKKKVRFKDEDEKKKNEEKSTEKNNINVTKILVLRGGTDFIKSYFNHNRVRIRIARSTALNFLLITIALLLLILFAEQPVFIDLQEMISLVIITLFLTLFSLWNWYKITKKYYEKAVEIEDLLLNKKNV